MTRPIRLSAYERSREVRERTVVTVTETVAERLDREEREFKACQLARLAARLDAEPADGPTYVSMFRAPREGM